MRAITTITIAALLLATVACSDDDQPAEEHPGLADAVQARWHADMAGQHGRLYDTLHPAQQDLIDRDQFLLCAAGTPGGPADITVTITDTYTETVTIPGTNTSTEAVAVTVTLAHQGDTEQITTRMFDTGDNDWRWATTDPAALTNC